MELIRTRDPIIPLKAACEVLGVPRATARRHLAPRMHGPPRPRPTSHRKFAEREEQHVLGTLHSERFQDQSPRQVYAELLDEGKYVGSPSTMYRILAAHGESHERRNQREARSHAVPRLEASAPNQVWTWDISKLATYASGVFLNLYLVLDLYSRFPVAWMIAERENSALSKQLFAEAITRYRLEPGSIAVHNDRGAPMTSGAFIDLLAQLGVECAHRAIVDSGIAALWTPGSGHRGQRDRHCERLDRGIVDSEIAIEDGDLAVVNAEIGAVDAETGASCEAFMGSRRGQ